LACFPFLAAILWYSLRPPSQSSSSEYSLVLIFFSSPEPLFFSAMTKLSFCCSPVTPVHRGRPASSGDLSSGLFASVPFLCGTGPLPAPRLYNFFFQAPQAFSFVDCSPSTSQGFSCEAFITPPLFPVFPLYSTRSIWPRTFPTKLLVAAPIFLYCSRGGLALFLSCVGP